MPDQRRHDRAVTLADETAADPIGPPRSYRGQNRGRGLMLMRGLTDSVEVIQRDEGTTVQLSRRLGEKAA